jgi:hypothetical protein
MPHPPIQDDISAFIRLACASVIVDPSLFLRQCVYRPFSTAAAAGNTDHRPEQVRQAPPITSSSS